VAAKTMPARIQGRDAWRAASLRRVATILDHPSLAVPVNPIMR
jgi:hypothetical protein